MSHLSELPDITFVEEDVATTVTQMMTVYEATTGRKLYPADPVRLFLLSVAKIIAHQRVLINHAKRMDHLKYAYGPYLDHIGVRTRTMRLPAASAQTKVRFTLSAPRPSVITIRAGTRITGGGSQLYFATKEIAEIAAESLTVDVACECSQVGVVGNGFLPGQLDVLVDPIPFVQSVANITESSGGTEIETDDAYRERIHMSPESYSTAGPEAAYQYWVKMVSPAIVDVSVSSPSAGVVKIVPLLAQGELPTQDVLDAVVAKVNDRTIRPLTDQVVVTAPETKAYDITLTYWVSNNRATEATTLQNQVATAVNEYMIWQKSKLGRDINPSELIRRVMEAGAHRVQVYAPVYTAVSATEIAIGGKPNITYGGMADD